MTLKSDIKNHNSIQLNIVISHDCTLIMLNILATYKVTYVKVYTHLPKLLCQT